MAWNPNSVSQSPWDRQRELAEGSARTQMAAKFTTQMFGWMAAGLGMSGVVAGSVMASPSLYAMVVPLMLPLIIVELVVVIGLSAALHKLSYAAAAGGFLFYSLLNGLTLAPVVMLYTAASAANVFFVTAGTFATMAVVGATTKRDLTSMGSFLMMGVVAMIITSVVNLFIGSDALQFAVSALGALIFTGLTAYDVQRFRKMGYQGFANAEERGKAALLGALNLYLDFVNLFLNLLRLFGNRR